MLKKRTFLGYWYWLVFALVSCGKATQEQTPMLQLMHSSHTGITFTNKVKETLNENVFAYTNFYNGGGVAVGDINNDGWVDIYLSANQHSGKLYLNKGNFQFEDITKASGLQGIRGWKTGVTMVDINQDGWLDLFICRSGRFEPKDRANLLFVNNRNMSFTEMANEYGLADTSTSLHASFVDYDLDGDLDMFLLNHAINPVREISKRFDEYGYDNEVGDKLYRNDNGHYVEVKQPAGIYQTQLNDGLGVAIGDLNNDMYPDVYVCNDFAGRDYLYFNDKQGRFTESALTAMDHISFSSMGVDMADINNDGFQDLMVLDMRSSTNYGRKTNMASMNPDIFNIMVKVGGHYQYMRNTLQLNNGDGSFSDIAPLAGVASTDWSWAPLFVDLDNDGYKDLLVTNGIRKNSNNKDFENFRKQRTRQESQKSNPDYAGMVKELLQKIPTEKVVNPIYRNMDGLSFEQKNDAWGMNLPTYSNGAAYADLDNDGDMDLIVNNIDDQAHIYQNHSSKLLANHSLRLKLIGKTGNVNGIGAKVEIRAGGVSQFMEQHVSRGYQSSVDYILHAGVGKSTIIDWVKVTWPDGKTSIYNRVQANQLLTASYDDAEINEQIKTKTETVFEEATAAYNLNHKHQENLFDDFKREVLLPHKMSTFGPALTVGDINSDGLDDFFIGGALGYPGALYQQTIEGSFVRFPQEVIEEDLYYEDTDAIFFDADQDNDLDLYVVSGGNEREPGNDYYQDRLYLNNGQGRFTKSKLPDTRASGGVVRAHDFDRDGDQDLFVGGRLNPGRYPEPGRSFLLQNDQGTFKDITTTYASDLSNVGMVTDALWSDYDGDGNKDLIVVGEWMPVCVFKHAGNKLVRLQNDAILDSSQGWWFSITEADVNSDGKMDYLLGNLGENYKYKARPGEPFNLYAKDFDNSGSLDIVLSYYENNTLYPLRGKQCSSEQIPGLKKKFKDYNAFGLASLSDVYGQEALQEATHLVSNTFSNSILISGESGFDLVKLPKKAQISAVFGILYDDYDQDGIKDVVIAGNLHNSEVETPRNDAGRGLFLKGEGNGVFTPVSRFDSGLNLPGDIKKLKPIKLGLSDGKKGLLAGVNDDFVQLITTK